MVNLKGKGSKNTFLLLSILNQILITKKKNFDHVIVIQCMQLIESNSREVKWM